MFFFEIILIFLGSLILHVNFSIILLVSAKKSHVKSVD
jgi:hypothetical protein